MSSSPRVIIEKATKGCRHPCVIYGLNLSRTHVVVDIESDDDGERVESKLVAAIVKEIDRVDVPDGHELVLVWPGVAVSTISTGDTALSVEFSIQTLTRPKE